MIVNTNELDFDYGKQSSLINECYGQTKPIHILPKLHSHTCTFVCGLNSITNLIKLKLINLLHKDYFFIF